MSADCLVRRYSFLLVWLICAATAVAAQKHAPGQAVHYFGHVMDHVTGEPLGGARIALTPSNHACVWRTDSSGEFSFWAPTDGDQRLTIEDAGHQSVALKLQGSALHEIRLSPSSRSVQLAALGGTAKLMPPSQAVAPAIVTAESRAKLSGRGLHWSPWYRLAIGKAPGGYTLYRVEFWLSGDRSCGAGAECGKIAESDREVVWKFRLQGHQEQGAPGRTYSVAHIRALYRAE